MKKREMKSLANTATLWKDGVLVFVSSFFSWFMFVRDFYEPTALNVYAVLLN